MFNLLDLFLYVQTPVDKSKDENKELRDRCKADLLSALTRKHPYHSPVDFVNTLKDTSMFNWKTMWRKDMLVMEVFPFTEGPKRMERFNFVIMREPHARENPSGSRGKYRRTGSFLTWDAYLVISTPSSDGSIRVNMKSRRTDKRRKPAYG